MSVTRRYNVGITSVHFMRTVDNSGD